MAQLDPDRLKALLISIDDQDSIVSEIAIAKGTVSMPQNRAIGAIFEEIEAYAPGFVKKYEGNGDPNGVRAQLRLARNRIQDKIDQLLSTPSQHSAIKPEDLVDKRRVFVVYGRNIKAKDALFALLRTINLDPIEWEEAIAMTGEGTPFTGHTLEEAFSRSQAAVILLTGDDLARLGKYFLNHTDPPEEASLTPQARPNVLFEAGMAFGRYPERTVIVSLGKTRPFSDIAGRHIIYISNSVASHQKLADRLRTAGCDVRTQSKHDWHTAGDFDSAMTAPDATAGKDQLGLKVTRREAQNAFGAGVEHKIWIEIRNDSEECHEIRYGGWKGTPLGIKSSQRSKAFQLLLDGNWYPPNKGLDRLKLPSGESCQTWISFDEPHSMVDIEQRCQSEGRIGILLLLVNSVEVEIVI